MSALKLRLRMGGGSASQNDFRLNGSPTTTAVQMQEYEEFVVTPAGAFAAPITYSLASGTLPHGLFIDPTTGSPFGSPWDVGTFAGIVVRGTDAEGRIADLSAFTITVGYAGTWVENTSELNAALSALASSGGVITLSADGDFLSTPLSTFTQQPSDWLELRGSRSQFGEQAHTKGVLLTDTRRMRFRFLNLGDSTSILGQCIGGTTGSPPQHTEVYYCEGFGQELEPHGDYSGGAPTQRRFVQGQFIDLKIVGCYVHSLNAGIKASNGVTGRIEYVGNSFDLIYDDAIQVNLQGGQVYSACIVKDNYATRFVGQGQDGGPNQGPHCDGIQVILNGSGAGATFILVCGNVINQGDARGSPQPLFVTAEDGAYYPYMQVFNNLFILWGSEEHSPDLGWQSGGYVWNNWAVRARPGEDTGLLQSKISQVTGGLPCALGDSFGENFGGLSDKFDNTLIPNTKEFYQSAFEGDFDGALPTTQEECVARYTPKADGPFAAARGRYDYATGEQLVSPRVWLPLAGITGVEVDTLIATGLLPVHGGGPAMAVSVPAGVEWRKADDAGGTNSTAFTSAPGTVDQKQFIELRVTSAAGPSDSVPIGVTIGGVEFSKYVTTASVLDFDKVTNAGVAWASRAAPPAATGQKKLILATKFMVNTTTSGRVVFSTTSSGDRSLIFGSGGLLVFRFVSSGTMVVVLDKVITTGVWHDLIIAIDFTAATQAETFTAVLDGEEVTPAAGATILTGASFSAASDLTTTRFLANFATTPVVTDGGIAFFWEAYGDGTMVVPDITSPPVYNSFKADNINLADGSGPLGYSPQVFYTANATSWNAGFANKGSLTLPVTNGATGFVDA